MLNQSNFFIEYLHFFNQLELNEMGKIKVSLGELVNMILPTKKN